jgi:predicted metalloprotease with PDZ domain
MARFEVGQKVLIVGVNRRGPEEATVIKVGRKLVTVHGKYMRDEVYRMSDGAKNDAYRHDRIITVEEFEEQQIRKALAKRLAEFGLGPVGYGGFKLPTGVLERLVAVLEEGEEQHGQDLPVPGLG